MSRRSPSGTALRDQQPEVHLTVAELARTVGMSPRNIRAHQARRLLPPPVRQGRTAYYHAGHIRRLETIKALQRQGFNLVAVQAILSGQDVDPAGDALAEGLRRLAAEHPCLVHALTRHRLVVPTEEGALRVIRPRAVRSTLDLHSAGVSTRPTVQVLIDVLNRVPVIADDLVRSTSARLATLSPGLGPTGMESWEDRDRRAGALASALAMLLTEAFRVAVERSSRSAVPELMAEREMTECRSHDTVEVGNG